MRKLKKINNSGKIPLNVKTICTKKLIKITQKETSISSVPHLEVQTGVWFKYLTNLQSYAIYHTNHFTKTVTIFSSKFMYKNKSQSTT